jgi:catechol 2,3-dioxygenase-like lactoylglutathione lyase family enzyme
MSLHHVALETRHDDIEDEVAFWRLLGFARVEPPETLRDRAVWVQREGRQVHLMYAENPVAPPAGHTAIVAPDYAVVVDRLADAGFEIDERPRHWGTPRCFVRSPGGHRVEIMAAPPS